MATFNKKGKRQQGAALLLIIMVLFVSISTMIFATANNQTLSIQQNLETRNELYLAKEMLLAYAMQYPDISGSSNGPGRLPCPDIDNDTNHYPETSCSTTVATFQGRLPQKLDPSLEGTLIFSNEYADIDQQFWYAVDPNFHTSTSNTVNSNSPGSGAFSLDGSGDIVAVLIAPGEMVGSQTRNSSATDDSNYLEGGNQNGTTYVSRYAADPDNFNDQIVTITHSELMTAAVNRVIQEVKIGLDKYHQGNYSSYGSSGYYYTTNPGHNNGGNCSGPWYGARQQYPRTYTYESGYSSYCIMRDEQYQFFNHAMSEAPSWYTSDGWDAVTQYTNSGSYHNATVSFTGCGIVFTFQFDTVADESIISRSQPEC